MKFLTALTLVCFCISANADAPNSRLRKKQLEDAKAHAPAAPVASPTAPKPSVEARPEAPLSPPFQVPLKEEIEFKVGETAAVNATTTENAQVVFCRGKDKENEEIFVLLDLTDGKTAFGKKEGKSIEYRDIKASAVKVWDKKEGFFKSFSIKPNVEFVIASASYVFNEPPKPGISIRAYVGEKFSWTSLRMTLKPYSREIELDCDVYQSMPSMDQLLKKRFVREIPAGRAAEPRVAQTFEYYKKHFSKDRLNFHWLKGWIEDALETECQVGQRGNGSVDESFLTNNKTSRAVGTVKFEMKPGIGPSGDILKRVHYNGNFTSGVGLEWTMTGDTLERSQTIRTTGRDPKLNCHLSRRLAERALEEKWKCRCDDKDYQFPMKEVEMDFWKCVHGALVEPALRSVCK